MEGEGKPKKTWPILANILTEKLPTIKIKEGINYKIEFVFTVSVI